jgi:hypothetical protein
MLLDSINENINKNEKNETFALILIDRVNILL